MCTLLCWFQPTTWQSSFGERTDTWGNSQLLPSRHRQWWRGDQCQGEGTASWFTTSSVLVDNLLLTIWIRWMVARSHGGFSLASPDPLTTVFTFLHVTPSPGELSFNGVINRLPCPLASSWCQSMWGSSRTRVGLTCSFYHLPACRVNLCWLCSSAKDNSFRLGRKTYSVSSWCPPSPLQAQGW